ncbi:MAG TPA: hypothetical protein VN257_04500, partial [Actinotalea sp.]|nr:hypothetical protein [Actinotalea sp.]
MPAPSARSALRPTVELLARPGFALLVATTFLAGAVLQVSVTQVARDRAQAEVTARAEALTAHVERTDRAEGARLTGQATAFAAQRRTDALVLARSAVRTADLLSASAADVVDEATLTPLNAAVADLSALVERTPGTTEVVAQAVRAVAAIPEPVPVPTAPSPTEPGADAVELLAGPTDPVETAAQAQESAELVREQTAQTAIVELDLEETARVVAAAEQ